ncbi:MAG TPA: hypothetical protein VLD62_07350 [Acidimicrobiia bacterium]|nr:hypothetical protein [Acidimicrobiia bacterium]
MKGAAATVAFVLVLTSCGGGTTASSPGSAPTTEAPAPSPVATPGTSAPTTTRADGAATTAPPATAVPSATTSTAAPPPTRVKPEGEDAPDFTLSLGEGGSFTLSDEQKPVYMVFWAEW